MSDQTFDRAVATEPDGKVRELNRDQYRSLSLKDRVRMLVEGRVRFYAGKEEVPAKLALKGL